MPLTYQNQQFKESKKFTRDECRGLGLKSWQCPTFQFIAMAIILLIIVLIVASRVVLDIRTSLIILFCFSGLMIISAYIIVKKYYSRFKND